MLGLKWNVLVVGDSHVQVFEHSCLREAFPWVAFDVVWVGGATASGLENPNSKTQASHLLREPLYSKKRYDQIFVNLGEVDVGFVIWYRAQKYQADVEVMMEMALENYQAYIREASQVAPVIVISVPLPTIADDNDWGEVANLRREVKASQRERTRLTLAFNRRMEEWCGHNEIDYLGLDDCSLGEDGLIAPKLLNEDPADHHYNPEIYALMLRDRLLPLLDD
ncbi:MAG: SGNH/GDSL hydrolase family protein [Zetaproteobacteria bacterium]|nr:MAG: SGNH/GDSL hydrolase family protein [Zetaproteobacteria bacterium]